MDARLPGTLILICGCCMCAAGMIRDEPFKKEIRKAEHAAGIVERIIDRDNPGKEAFSSLKEINKQLACFLDTGNLGIRLPVVQGQDNEYWLHHLFDGSEGTLGTAFIDARHEEGDGVMLVYGHAVAERKDAMFTPLERLCDPVVFKDADYIRLCKETCIEVYEITDVIIWDSSRPDLFTTAIRNFSPGSFKEWYAWLRRHAVITSAKPLSCSDRFLILQTCTDGYSSMRLSVVAVFHNIEQIH